MMKKIITTSAAAATLAVSANAAVITNLHDSLTSTDLSGAIIGTTTFDSDGWSFFQGFTARNELTYSETLGDNDVTGFGGSEFQETGWVATATGFAGSAPPSGQLSFHPGQSGNDPGDLIIRWTADADYTNVTIDHTLDNFAAAGNGVIYGISINGGAFATIEGTIDGGSSTGTTDQSDFAALASISNGDTIDLVIGNKGSFNSDEVHGNFVINTVPEPSSTALLGLGGLALILRRRK